jgi:hypothetical protein
MTFRLKRHLPEAIEYFGFFLNGVGDIRR